MAVTDQRDHTRHVALDRETVDARQTGPGSQSMWDAPEALYVHVPFCRHRCGYCNFSVVTQRDDLQSAMVDAMIAELDALAGQRQTMRSVFLGGGTPTHLRIDELARLIDAIDQVFSVAPDAEISIEANPEDITATLCEQIAALGINRMSLGVQSFVDRKLSTLERSHNGAEARDAVSAAAASIGNVSIDLIFGCPEEPLETWLHDVDIAVSLPLDHVSTYALTVEKGTAFWNRFRRGELLGIDEDVELGMIEFAESTFDQAGLKRYEISNFARQNRRCQHNISYWSGASWHAIGPGAARFVDGVRSVNHRSPTTYLRRVQSGQSPTAESESLTAEQAARERAAFGVRMIDGIDLDLIADATEFDLVSTIESELAELSMQGLIDRHCNHIRLTERGKLFADTVAARIL
ncbi:MAG: radical SAM family heme chaperone HemW [Planctomycetota bacterium]